jgi:hypothetical protein
VDCCNVQLNPARIIHTATAVTACAYGQHKFHAAPTPKHSSCTRRLWRTSEHLTVYPPSNHPPVAVNKIQFNFQHIWSGYCRPPVVDLPGGPQVLHEPPQLPAESRQGAGDVVHRPKVVHGGRAADGVRPHSAERLDIPQLLPLHLHASEGARQEMDSSCYVPPSLQAAIAVAANTFQSMMCVMDV